MRPPYRKPNSVDKTLGSVRLGGSNVVPKGFKPFTVHNVAHEQDVVDILEKSAEAGDVEAKFLLGLLESLSVNDLIVEGVIRIQP